ncbi:23S rRNA pseudouridine(2604) synthase RluF [Arsukibacterium indicum]|uniref:Pseudouridine synthase n=1 Tax=Arsukibacterium indicum TaxID=2848612 RepID=A0ABS6MLV0_9GAMM|nr:23S rRNA pseudouridine(2604) synthase RluF [Arsukibacterium indicum]MBV2129777.1 23S rRNA pseudouridine(2604) synthase RluF [Arsukibacterium indicum]
MTEPTLYRLNKFISDTGFCSRRQADKYIEQGLVTVNGQPAPVGLKVSASDEVRVEGKPLKEKPARIYLAYHKPVGITCTTERHVKGNIIDAIGYPERIFPIGRLDKPSEGLIFLTNDGDIVNKVLRAGNAHEKEYTVTVNKPVTANFITKMASGVPILDTVTLPCTVTQISKNTFKIILTQGLNRQIRRMTEYLGYDVVKLKRTRIMHVRLAELRAGQWRLLDEFELSQMEQLLQHSSKTATDASQNQQDDEE